MGKPIAMLLLEREATVTVTHIETRDISDITRSADVVVAVAGSPHLVHGYWIKPGAVVIDVGITRVAQFDDRSGLLATENAVIGFYAFLVIMTRMAA